MGKPRIFIGSSTEGLNVAYAVQQNLEHTFEVTVWNQDVFNLSLPVITSLINSLSNFDAAIFVFSSDDITNIRGNDYSTIRDNVIFETGLFIGRIGINRVFFLKPRNPNNLHLPSDLLGVAVGEYDPNRSDGNLVAATGAFCSQVRHQLSIPLTTSPSDNDLTMIEVYLKANDWTAVSFRRLEENVNPKFSEEYVMELVERYPLRIRRSKLKSGEYGIKLVQP
jgi:hypothetical protein